MPRSPRQGRPARGGAERGARAGAAEHPCRASGHRRRRGHRMGARTDQGARGRRGAAQSRSRPADAAGIRWPRRIGSCISSRAMPGRSRWTSVRSARNGDSDEQRGIPFRLRQPERLSEPPGDPGHRAADRREVRLCAGAARRRVQADQQPLAGGEPGRHQEQAGVPAAGDGALHAAPRHHALRAEPVLPGQHAGADARRDRGAAARRLRALRRRDVSPHVGGAEEAGRSRCAARGAGRIAARRRQDF